MAAPITPKYRPKSVEKEHGALVRSALYFKDSKSEGVDVGRREGVYLVGNEMDGEKRGGEGP